MEDSARQLKSNNATFVSSRLVAIREEIRAKKSLNVYVVSKEAINLGIEYYEKCYNREAKLWGGINTKGDEAKAINRAAKSICQDFKYTDLPLPDFKFPNHDVKGLKENVPVEQLEFCDENIINNFFRNFEIKLPIIIRRVVVKRPGIGSKKEPKEVMEVQQPDFNVVLCANPR